jgi:rhodanese-related sulfurtransferase
MVRGGAALVEVLPAEEYEAEHLPGAINIPLPQLDRQSTAALQRDQPIIVYCYDLQESAKCRAACLHQRESGRRAARYVVLYAVHALP